MIYYWAEKRMNNRNPNLREKYLDGENLFRKYYEMGDAKSIGRLTKYAISQGMTSSSGQEPTQMGVWKSMWRWASLKENRETAWKIYKQFNPSHTPEYWVEYMIGNIKTAWQFPTNSKYIRFLKENGWQ